MNNSKLSLLSLQEASDLLHCHPNTLRQWDKRGLLQAIRVGARGDRRYREEDIRSFLSQSKEIHSLASDFLNVVDEACILLDNAFRLLYINTKALQLLQETEGERALEKLFSLSPQITVCIKKHFSKKKKTNKIPLQNILCINGNLYWEISVAFSHNQVSIVIADKTRIKKQEEHMEFLKKVHFVLSSTLDYKQTLSNISNLIVPNKADWFAVELLDNVRGLYPVEIVHEDPKKIDLAFALLEQSIVNMTRQRGSPEVIRTGKSEIYSHVTDDLLRLASENEKQLQILRQMHISSAMIVPLQVAGKIIGTATFMYTHPSKHYAIEDLPWAEEIGRLAGFALDNARLYSNLQIELDQRKKTEASLRLSEERLEKYLDHSIDCVQIVDGKGNITYSSASVERISGHTREEIVGLNAFDYFHPDDKGRVFRIFQDLLKSPGKSINVEYRIKTKKGKWIWLETIGTNLLHDPAIRGIVANFRNITDRKIYESALIEKAELINRVHEAVIMLDWNRKITLWNPEAERLYGWTNKEAVGKMSSRLLHTVFPIPFTHVQKCLKKSGVWEGEVQHITKAGKKIIAETRWALVKGAEGKTHVLEVIRDITGRKELEQRKDSFISIASHELKTPLTSLKVFAQFLQKYSASNNDKVLQKYLQRIMDQTENLSELVTNLLDISKMQIGKITYKKDYFDFMEYIQERTDVAKTIYSQKITLTGKLPGIICGDKERLCQVFDNLLSNAAKYSPDAARIDIFLSSNEHLAKICVKDYGIGIEKKHQKKIFERFFREEGESEQTFPGLGIGLYISSEIIKRHGGEIQVKSEKGKGSEFCFTIPLQV